MSKQSKPIYWLVFVVYMIILIKVLFFNMSLEAVKAAVTSASIDSISNNLKLANFIPLKNINAYTLMYFRPGMKEIGMRILWFMPLGFFIPSLTKHRRFKHTLIVGLLVILFFEVLQIILSLGRFDIDDIILNGLGIVFGYMVYKAFK